jgi:hypothetical protein
MLLSYYLARMLRMTQYMDDDNKKPKMYAHFEPV